MAEYRVRVTCEIPGQLVHLDWPLTPTFEAEDPQELADRMLDRLKEQKTAGTPPSGWPENRNWKACHLVKVRVYDNRQAEGVPAAEAPSD